MDRNERAVIEGLTDKADRHLQAARKHLESHIGHSECVEASQECVELSVKAVLSFLEIDYPHGHEWAPDKKTFADIAKQIQDRHLLDRLAEQNLDYSIRLPRLLMLMNFWGQFYITAKYGFEAGSLAAAEDLFQREEAELAVKYAGECYRAASRLRYLSDSQLRALTGS